MKEPVIYNKGTKWEESNDTFLSYYTYKSIEEAILEVKELNSTHPMRLFNGQIINWGKIDHFFVDSHEMIDTSNLS